jgi:S-DNA-T family DNA segregation ATPase FtsK/SpoIIIE
MAEHLPADKIKKEITGVTILLIGIFILISFVSYYPNDRAFYFVYNIEKVNNWGGVVGSTLARAMFQLIGLVSYIIPLFLGLLAYQFFTASETRFDYLRSVSSVIMILSLIGLFDLSLGLVKIRGDEMVAGGILGSLLTRYLMRYLNQIGTYCFYLSFLISGQFIILSIFFRLVIE